MLARLVVTFSNAQVNADAFANAQLIAAALATDHAGTRQLPDA